MHKPQFKVNIVGYINMQTHFTRPLIMFASRVTWLPFCWEGLHRFVFQQPAHNKSINYVCTNWAREGKGRWSSIRLLFEYWGHVEGSVINLFEQSCTVGGSQRASSQITGWAANLSPNTTVPHIKRPFVRSKSQLNKPNTWRSHPVSSYYPNTGIFSPPPA